MQGGLGNLAKKWMLGREGMGACFLPAPVETPHSRRGGSGERPEIVSLPHPASLPKVIFLGKADILQGYILLQVGVIPDQAPHISDKAGILSVSHTAAATWGMEFQLFLGSPLLTQPRSRSTWWHLSPLPRAQCDY